jgi:hypothetical protein
MNWSKLLRNKNKAEIWSKPRNWKALDPPLYRKELNVMLMNSEGLI